MVFDIKKKLFSCAEPYVVTQPAGGAPFIIQAVDSGMFIANEKGEPIAQLVFEKTGAVIAIAEDDDAVSIAGDGKITTAKGNDKYLVYGNPSTYTYDVFIGRTLVAKVAPKYFDRSKFSINHMGGNVLRIVLIALALEAMCLNK